MTGMNTGSMEENYKIELASDISCFQHMVSL